MITEAIGKVVSNQDLTEEEMTEVMQEIITREASPAQIASFITALRMKGETPEEVTVAARIIREKTSVVNAGDDVVCLDREEITVERETIVSTTMAPTEGTTTFNVSTATALVVAGEGVRVVKYGRKSASPFCGSAEVVEALGINLDMTRTQQERCIERIGICFLYDPLVQNGLGHIISIRRQIGLRTMFNLLDPLINPARARVQLLGVYEPGLTQTMATVLKNLGIRRGLVVHGEGTLDEISIIGQTKITEFRDGMSKTYFMKPEDFGMKRGKLVEIKGGTKEENAEIIREILNGGHGAKRNITVLNAAAVFFIAEKAKDLNEGIELANCSIDSRQALDKLERLVEFTNTEHKYLRKVYEAES